MLHLNNVLKVVYLSLAYQGFRLSQAFSNRVVLLYRNDPVLSATQDTRGSFVKLYYQ